jgi:hypothetical protein
MRSNFDPKLRYPAIIISALGTFKKQTRIDELVFVDFFSKYHHAIPLYLSYT